MGGGFNLNRALTERCQLRVMGTTRSLWLKARERGRGGGDGARELGWGPFGSGGGRRSWSLLTEDDVI